MLLELLEDEGKNSRDTILICAVNDNAKQSLLHAYAAKFSVRIDLPSLKARRLEEGASSAITPFSFANRYMR